MAMRSVLLVLLASATLACAGTPSKPIAPGSRVVVALYDGTSGSRIALANESHPIYGGVYSRQRSDAALKLAPDDLMGELLASLENAGYDRFARPAPRGRPSDPLFRGAFGLDAGAGFVALSQDDVVTVFTEPGRGDPAEERQAYSRLKLVMDLYYTPVGGLQYVENDQGAALFDTDGRR